MVVAVIGVSYGDIRRLANPTDSNGMMCGVNNGKNHNYEKKPYLLFYDFFICLKMGVKVVETGCPTEQVCVSECPDSNQAINASNYKTFINKGYCPYAKPNDSLKTVVDNKTCPLYTFETNDLLKRCIPTIFTINMDPNKTIHLFNSSMKSGELTDISKKQGIYASIQSMGIATVSDIYNTRLQIMMFSSISIAIGLFTLIILRFFIAPLTHFVLIATVVLLSAGSYFFIKRYNDFKNAGGEAWPGTFSSNLKSYGDYYNLNLTIGIIFIVILVVILLIILAIYKNIRIAIQLLRETSKAVKYVWGVYFWGLLNMTMLVLVTFICIIIAGYIQTMGKPEYAMTENKTGINSVSSAIKLIPCAPNTENPMGNICRFVKYGDTSYRRYLYAFILFMWFWIVQFIDGINTCVIAGSFSGYYWSLEKPKDIPAAPTIKSVKVTFRYHLGSIAFGSLLIAIVKFIRISLEYMSAYLNKYDNKFVRGVMIALKCCFWCLDKILKFITENAFVYLIIHGSNFCISAKRVFNLILSNAMSKIVTNVLARLIVFLFIFCSTSLTTLLAYLWFVEKPDMFVGFRTSQLNYEIVPVIVVAIIAFLVNRALFEIYNAGVNTIFICFLEDLDLNEGSTEKPYYMSRKLHKIVGKSRMISQDSIKSQESKKSQD